MKHIMSSLMNNISFRAKTTILMWIIVIGFALVASVGILALMGLKSEFDINSLHNHNIHTLMLLTESDARNKQNLPYLLEMWEQHKIHDTSRNIESAIVHLRRWYAKTFMPNEYWQIQTLLQAESTLIESIDRAFINSDTLSMPSLLKEQVLLSFDIAFYGKKITDSLYKNTYIILAIFMFIVIATIIILALSIGHSINTNHLLLEQLVQSKTKELQALNANLQKSIEYEVEQNRKKDLIMYQQARLASMGEMIQNIAHQWRQPLNSLMMLIQSFKSKAMQNKLDNEFVLQQTQYGMKIATEMSNTIENFRNFFRPETSTEVFEPATSIWDSLELLKEQIKENHIYIDVLIKKANLSVNGYQNSFMQVILILINNAIDALKLKAQSNEDFKAHIEILLDKVGYNIVLCIKDNAGGIGLEDKTKVFEPYFTTKHKSVGTGVGLYMAKQIIERHFNGSIDVSNTQWKEHFFGAEFNIHIPTQGSDNEI
ncbi:HAMP domain-containing sensor histidine kinase [uncultured Helicobacter sp.]|uniref:sensor histidine kinase n=1 Tax=uncultured Helicobacter sp. TaxID=175537 RepID=UPI00260AF0B9|nr:HAMP domain-containing sensor histidine kinase [uncultured Helicobacter sp.]